MLTFLNILYPHLAIGLCSVHTINAMVNALPVKYSNIKVHYVNNNDRKHNVYLIHKTTKPSTQNYDTYYA